MTDSIRTAVEELREKGSVLIRDSRYFEEKGVMAWGEKLALAVHEEDCELCIGNPGLCELRSEILEVFRWP